MSSSYLLFIAVSISALAQCGAFLWGCSTCCSTCGGGSSIVGYGYVPPTTSYYKVPVYGIIRGRPQAPPRTQIIRQYIPVERPYVAPPRYRVPPPPPGYSEVPPPPAYSEVPPPPPPSEYEQGPVESAPPPMDYSDTGASSSISESASYGGQESIGDVPVAKPLSESSPFRRMMLSARRTV